MRLTWAQPEDLVPHELVQLAHEGADVTAIAQRWHEAGGDLTPAVSGASAVPATPQLRALARELLAELTAIEPPIDPAQPDDWEQIRALLQPAGSANLATPGAADYRTRLDGAWLGRSVGCLLGKPVEKIPRAGIEAILRDTDRWPLDFYFTAQGLSPEVAQRWPWNRRSAPTSLAENINGMPEDDDLNYPLLALALLEDQGFDFTTDDVATLWLNNLPAGRVFTAERAAYRNILDARPVPETATHLNPFREWIGALIRTDVFGWALPGRMLDAAYLAWLDARLSHTRNGIYGAMWAGALGSAAMVAPDVTQVLDLASTVVPASSELAHAISFGRATAGRHDLSLAGITASLDELHSEFGHLHWVHTLNNAAVIAYALQAVAELDSQVRTGESGTHNQFSQGIALAVLPGWDTDSAGATVGGVLGALAGRSGIGQRWFGPLNEVIGTSLPGGPQQIPDLVDRTLAVARQGANWQPQQ